MRTDLGWRLDPSIAYLNHGSFGACPEPVLVVQSAWRERMEREPIRFLDHELEGLLDDARHALGRFLNADPDGLAFVPNATAGLNAVLGSLRFEPGDELLTTDHEYNAAITTTRAAAERAGASVVVAAVPFPLQDASEVVDAIMAAVTPRTRLAVISHVTSPTGLVLPIGSIVERLEERGVDTLVDGAHAPGMVPLELDALRAAYYTGNAHKWLCAPKGTAFLWVRRDRRDSVHPQIVSHGANDPRTDRPRFRLEFDWTGTPDPTASLTIPGAIDWMSRQVDGGWPAIMASNRAMALAVRDRLGRALRIGAPAPDGMIGSMVALPLVGVATDVEAERLHLDLFEQDRIEVPVGGWPVRGARAQVTDAPRRVLLRFSAQRYVEEADVDRLLEALTRRGLTDAARDRLTIRGVTPCSAGPRPRH
jgi:isopenicillin-N epimerase